MTSKDPKMRRSAWVMWVGLASPLSVRWDCKDQCHIREMWRCCSAGSEDGGSQKDAHQSFLLLGWAQRLSLHTQILVLEREGATSCWFKLLGLCHVFPQQQETQTSVVTVSGAQGSTGWCSRHRGVRNQGIG